MGMTTLSGTGKPRWIDRNGITTCSPLWVACLANTPDRLKLKLKLKRGFWKVKSMRLKLTLTTTVHLGKDQSAP
ncbi:hypothetical protein FOQG_19613 [Fusarium oxysporum f. sp. raphani 54005]|uniref:Uncharacterized protein n=1 Tax=Fusarium oxysporum f. sp. raphani 54005 TaxID=1089458 RepID=X0B0H5_FUSOX|nr:hypothetical protein FOQG_19613 [Fusarium oxysporum f. sp. raphani 54005]